jgi:type I restriction enzyme M protein
MSDIKNASYINDDSPIDVTREVNFIWSVANKLRGTYQSDKYKDVIIPMTIIRRFECALAPTKAKVVAKAKADPNFPAKAMYNISGYHFYNSSEFDLEELTNDSDNLAANFKSYLQGFSNNVMEILLSSEKGLDFGKQIDKMDKNNRLFSVVKAFSEIDLDPKTVDNIKMGYIFEELIRKFSENAEAGDHYTGRDIIRLMVDILLSEGCDDIFEEGKVITILDQACGTGGMLSTAYNHITRFNPTANVKLFGQEINPESYAMCLAEMLIKGQNADNVRYQDTMKADCFSDIKMRFVIENPPFGTAWGGKDAAEGVEKAVKDEHKKSNSRWGIGLPGSGDMQMLFLQSAVDKMDENYGRCAIIENGSPLFTGGTASGESQIRRWLLENDLIEAIIQLPTDLFYNTGITTYIWILSKNKRQARKGKVQLIDASGICHQLRKALGNKRFEITREDRNKITELYTEFLPNELSRIYDNTEFIYREYTVMQPLQRSYAIDDISIWRLKQKGTLSGIYDARKIEELESKDELSHKDEIKLRSLRDGEFLYTRIFEALEAAKDSKKYLSPTAFAPVLEKVLEGVTDDKNTLEKIAEGLSVMDKSAEIQKDRKGNIIYDKETKDTEIVKFEESIDDYMKREVLPHVPDAKAFFEENLSKKTPIIKTGAEIPFTRYFYKYQVPIDSQELAKRFEELEVGADSKIANLFK